MTASSPKVLVLYHYFYPDDVVSARHFGDFCGDLAGFGWDVETWPCNRGCRDETRTFTPRETWGDVAIRRIWRPAFRQASGLGRLSNALWMLSSWCAKAWQCRAEAPHVLVIGTDPVLSVLMAPLVRRLSPRVRIAHWCFDLYPEAPIAEGLLRGDGWLTRGLQRMLRSAYASCDLVADLGYCMRERLEAYGHSSRKVTLVPWALAEPQAVAAPEPATRRDLFGDARMGLLYSGNYGRAHSHQDILELARRLRGHSVHFCFGVRGNRETELRAAVQPADANVSFAGFAPEATLERRLAAADIHLVSLRPEWTGLVVPSKFFGSLAAGRPVIFAGARDAAIARWIQQYQVGWVLDAQSQDTVAAQLVELLAAPQALKAMQAHCHRIYQQHFSRSQVMKAWNQELRQLLVP